MKIGGNMNKKIFKRIVIIFIFVVIFFNVTENIFAEINDTYSSSPVTDEALEKKITGSSLLDPIASLIYALASLLEWIIGAGFESLTGTNMFPWADKVIFNSVPLLDINFLDPAKGSLFLKSDGTTTILADIVTNIYFSILSISIAFLGVIVAIMAIKLAISSIASEKAKYKEAITNWLFAIVLLFTAHYAIAFIFYVNEQMVKVASNILETNLEDATIAIDFTNSSVDDKTIVKNFIDKNNPTLTGSIDNQMQYVIDHSDIAGYLLRSETYVKNIMPSANGSTDPKGIWYKLSNPWNWTDYKKYLMDRLYQDTIYIQGSPPYENTIMENLRKEVQEYSKNPTTYVNNTKNNQEIRIRVLGTIPRHQSVDDIDYYVKYISQFMAANKIKLQAYDSIVLKKDVAGEPIKIIQDMGEYFKTSAFTYSVNSSGEVTGWRPTKLTVQGAILYAVFIVQSFLFFLAYIKRFFYIVILAVMAPLIIIYSFFTKSLA